MADEEDLELTFSHGHTKITSIYGVAIKEFLLKNQGLQGHLRLPSPRILHQEDEPQNVWLSRTVELTFQRPRWL